MPIAQPTIQISYSIWSSTDAAITTWRWAGNAGTILQVIILVALLALAVVLLRRFFERFASASEAGS